MREKLSKLIIEILHHCEANQMVEVFVPQLVANLSLLIQDSIPTVRQGAVDAVLGLHKYALYLTMHSRVTNSVVTDVANGTKLLVKLESTGVRPQVLRLIGEGIDANIANQEQFQPATLDVNGRVTNDSVVTSGKENITRESTVKENNKLSATTTGAGELKRTLSSETHEETDLEAVRAGTLRASGTTTKAHVSNNVHSISEHQLLSTKSPLASLVSLKPPTCGADVSCFHPSSYFPILKLDGTVAKPMRLYSEKDLTAVFEKISSGIMNLDDWQARMAALSLIQGVVSGDGCEYMALLVQYLKSIHEHVGIHSNYVVVEMHFVNDSLNFSSLTRYFLFISLASLLNR